MIGVVERLRGENEFEYKLINIYMYMNIIIRIKKS